MEDKIREWLQYKAERQEDYRPTGLHSLLTVIARNAAKYGESAVTDIIDISMANNWQGIVWNQITNSTAGAPDIKPARPRDGTPKTYQEALALHERKKLIPMTYEEAKALHEQKKRGSYIDAVFNSIGGA